MAAALIGVFVGGASRRMGGFPKGNLTHQGRTLLSRTLDACELARARLAVPGGTRVPIHLIGESSAYADVAVPRLPDEPAGCGPMGGLRALLIEAARCGLPALALSCDLPFLTPELIGRALVEASRSAALAPRQGGKWQPLFARYDHAVVLPIVEQLLASNRTSLQGVFQILGDGAVELQLSEAEHWALRDWDEPSDMLERRNAN